MENTSNVKMGTTIEGWSGIDGDVKTITFSITEDCNLACKYCYMTGKNSKKKMTFDMGKSCVDYILSNREIFKEKSVIWEFIGGEPFLEIKLIDELSDYIKQQMFLLNHPWFNSYRFSFSSNGLLYDSPEVQKYIAKNRDHISIGISIDGNKLKHDLQRVFPNNTGSYDEVMKRVPLWLEQFPGNHTKSTFAHDDLPYLKDSIISLWNAGIKNVAANVIFEDVWIEGDDEIFESQLKELADYVLDNKLWEEYSVRFFEPSIGFPLKEEDKERNFCGAGKMLAIDTEGKFYPCVRFLDFTLSNKKGICLGDVDSGINTDRIRPFSVLSLKSQSPEKCVNCDVATGCAWCTGFNYDSADSDTVYQRATFICKMHKANVRATKYFWDKFEQVTGLESERSKIEKARNNNIPEQYLQIMTSDMITPHCTYRNTKNTRHLMDKEIFNKSLKFASEHNFTTVILGDDTLQNGNKEEFFKIVGTNEALNNNEAIKIYDNTGEPIEDESNMCILLLNMDNLQNLYEYVADLYPRYSRINVILEDIEKWGDKHIAIYEKQLEALKELVVNSYKEDSPVELNILTDRIFAETMCNCDAGNTTYTVAPNGKIYICPAFYFDDPENHIGDLDSGIHIKNAYLMELENAGICSQCDAYNCRRCKYLNKKLTGEYNIPSKIQCVISHIERNASRKLQEALIQEGLINRKNIINEIDYLDPLEKILILQEA